MRWKQHTYRKSSCYLKGSSFTVLVTKETVAPFRSFEQSRLEVKGLPLDGEMWKNGKLITIPLWLLPENIDELIEEMDKAREDKNWSRSDEIRDYLNKSGIVVRNGVDWYPILLEREHKAEKGALAWYYSNAMSGIKGLKGEDRDNAIKRINNVQADWEKEIKDKYNL